MDVVLVLPWPSGPSAPRAALNSSTMLVPVGGACGCCGCCGRGGGAGRCGDAGGGGHGGGGSGSGGGVGFLSGSRMCACLCKKPA